MGMKVLVVGGGGREHAIVWKVAQSPKVEKIYCAPGNAGIAELAECVPIGAMEFDKLTAFAREKEIDLTIVGMDDPLVGGIVDAFEAEGLRVFGPRKNAAILEGSKAFSKNLMKKYNIPTASYETFKSPEDAIAYLEKNQKYPIVLKADGLALGKGVVVAQTIDEAKQAVREMMEGGKFGKSGARVLIEECMVGREVTELCFCDGRTIVPMVASQDHKRVFDGDKGPNTGGMGAFAPSPLYTPEIAARTTEEILLPTLRAMNAEGFTFKGVLYVGLMLTADGPKVVEYNARFGDPETQAVLPLLTSDLMEIMMAVREQRLDESMVRFADKAAACIILASGGYPGKYEGGKAITGIDAAEKRGATVYHAGTKLSDGQLVTAGGRVLGVTATGDTMRGAVDAAYAAAREIHFEGAHMRSDIGSRDC